MALLRDRYRVVLVDEFQDTDPIQWEIMRRAFAAGGGTLVLIGDPKQAIYSFRGADVYAYLRAARSAGAEATLQVNWRCDQPLLRRLRRAVRQRRARPPRDRLPADARRGASGARPDVGAPLRLRVAHREARRAHPQRARVRAAGPRVHRRTTSPRDVVALLEPRGDGRRRATIAVLVRTNRTAALIRDALARAGRPRGDQRRRAACSGPSPAGEWLRLLDAIERPRRCAPARRR